MNQRRGRQGVSTVLAIGGLAGLLIWTKLRLVSDLPRSAYAVPPEIDPGDGDAERVGPDKADGRRDADEPSGEPASD